jgi:hypothetical protein
MKRFLGCISGSRRDVLGSMLLNHFQKETIMKKQSISRRLVSLLAVPLIGLALTLPLSFGAAAQTMFWSDTADCAGNPTAVLPNAGAGTFTAHLCGNIPATEFLCDFSVKFRTNAAGDSLFAVTGGVMHPDLNSTQFPAVPWAIINGVPGGNDFGAVATIPGVPAVPDVLGNLRLATYTFSVGVAAGPGPFTIETVAAFPFPASLNVSTANNSCSAAVTTELFPPAAPLTLTRAAAPTYDVAFTTPSVAVNGVTATGTFAPANPHDPSDPIAVTITLTGAATAPGTHAVGLTSAKLGVAGITAPAVLTKAVTAGQPMVAGDTFAFSFTMPADDVDDLVVTHTFTPAATYNVGFTTPSVAVNGVTATGTFSPVNPQYANDPITVTITLTGTATAAGTHTVGLTSALAGVITPPATGVTKGVAAGDVMGAGDTFVFTFTMPANNVNNLVVTHTFVAGPFVSLTNNAANPHNFGTRTVGYGALTPLTVTVNNIGNAPSGLLTVSMVSPNFAITNDNLNGIALAAAGSNTFGIAPIPGLAVGSYSATITVSDGAVSTNVVVNFNVIAVPLSSTTSIPVLGPVGLVLLALALGGLAFRQRRRV